MTLADLAERLARVEAELARLRTGGISQAKKRRPVDALEAIHGTFADDDAYREAARLGKRWRKSQRNGSDARRKRASK
ncbi:MAG TPA: hypothetical protein VHQ47_18920 [Phycisphaerae bacterium]|nr:hypothetical protein [Phycisphaerae bacterium]